MNIVDNRNPSKKPRSNAKDRPKRSCLAGIPGLNESIKRHAKNPIRYDDNRITPIEKRLRNLDKLLAMGESVPGNEKKSSTIKRKKTKRKSTSAANKLARNPNLIDAIVADCHAMGIVGERNNITAIYCIGTSRLCNRPLSGIVRGESSSGKSWLVETIAKLFPPEHVLHATKMSPQALFYYEGGLAHKFIVGGERSHKQDSDAAEMTAALRQLQSEGRITKLVTENEEGQHVTREVEQTGPIAYVETTTLKPKQIFSEDLNRALLLKTDESPGHTRAILRHAAGQYGETAAAADVGGIIEKHRDLQRYLQSCKVVIPFALELLEQIPTSKVESRRVGNQILAVIETVTLLHQFQRKRNDNGQLVATIDDYEIAKSILIAPLGESLGVPASAAKFYKKLKKKFPSGKVLTTSEAQKIDLRASESSVKNWLRQLAAHGCIVQVEKAKGPKPAKWRLTDKTPESAVLPDLS